MTGTVLLPADVAGVAEAARLLRAGGLVAFGTETVFGLGADATNDRAVAGIFAAKGRPHFNPLICHYDRAEAVFAHVEADGRARALAEAFWPGPLTLVLPRQPHMLDAVTAGLDTVAVRVPDHNIALALLRAVGAPLSAPSANTFMRLSPTRAQDIEPELQRQLACTLDGGPCRIGLESTVVDCAGAPRVLRPGGVPREALARALGCDVPLAVAVPAGGPRAAPGMYARHYAPRTPLRLAAALGPDDAGLCFGAPANARQVAMPADPESYGASLYRVLHALDALGARELVVQAPPADLAWEAVADRLRKAAAAG